MDHTDNGKDQMLGNQDNDTLVPFQKKQRRNMGRLPCQNVQYGQKAVDTDWLALSVWKNCREYVTSHGMGF